MADGSVPQILFGGPDGPLDDFVCQSPCQTLVLLCLIQRWTESIPCTDLIRIVIDLFSPFSCVKTTN